MNHHYPLPCELTLIPRELPLGFDPSRHGVCVWLGEHQVLSGLLSVPVVLSLVLTLPGFQLHLDKTLLMACPGSHSSMVITV